MGPVASSPMPNSNPMYAPAYLEPLQHLLPDDIDIYGSTARHLFLSKPYSKTRLVVALTVAANLSVLYRDSNLPLENLRVVRAKITTKTVGARGKEETKDSFYCTLIALHPQAAPGSAGFTRLATGLPYSGDASACRKEAIRSLRDVLEAKMHELLQQATREANTANSTQTGSSSDASSSQALTVDVNGSSQPPPYMTATSEKK